MHNAAPGESLRVPLRLSVFVANKPVYLKHSDPTAHRTRPRDHGTVHVAGAVRGRQADVPVLRPVRRARGSIRGTRDEGRLGCQADGEGRGERRRGGHRQGDRRVEVGGEEVGRQEVRCEEERRQEVDREEGDSEEVSGEEERRQEDHREEDCGEEERRQEDHREEDCGDERQRGRQLGRSPGQHDAPELIP